MNNNAQIYPIASRMGEDWPCWLLQRGEWIHTSGIQFKLEGLWEKENGITHWSPDHDKKPGRLPFLTIPSGIRIDKDVPVPAMGARQGRKKYPFSEMMVGDSFYCEADLITGTAEPSKETIARVVRALGTAAYCWARHHKNGRLFAVRADSMGARIWRIK